MSTTHTPIEPVTQDMAKAIAQSAISHVTHGAVTVPMRADVIAGLLGLSTASAAMTRKQVSDASRKYSIEDLCSWSYELGIRDAEQHHGIQVADQEG